MSIAISCPHCGKALKVPDERVGKLAQCPGCMKTFTVLPANAPAIHASISETIRANQPAISISSGTIMWLIILVCIVGIGAAIVFGPVRVIHQWDALKPHAQSAVEDVVTRGLQSYESHLPWFNPKKDHINAGVREISFYFLPTSLSLPDRIPFKGMSTQGKFVGTYSPRTGEVSVVAEVGAMTFEGISNDITKANGSIRITGRNINGNLTAEVDGKNATVVTPYSTTNP